MATPAKRLRPWHPRAAILLAAGRSRRDVARALGRSPGAVSAARRTPGFEALLAGAQRRVMDAVVAAFVGTVGPPRPCRHCGAGESPRRLAAEGPRRRVVQASASAVRREKAAPTEPRLSPEAIAILQRLNQPGAGGPT